MQIFSSGTPSLYAPLYAILGFLAKKNPSPRGGIPEFRINRRNELAEEREDSRAVLVRLCEHRLSSLEKNVVLRVLRHLLCHIRIANRGLGVLDVLGLRREVRSRVAETRLDSTDVGLLVERLLESGVDRVDRSVCLVLGLDADDRAIRALHAECERTHIRHADLDRLVRLHARLENESVVLGLVLCRGYAR